MIIEHNIGTLYISSYYLYHFQHYKELSFEKFK